MKCYERVGGTDQLKYNKNVEHQFWLRLNKLRRRATWPIGGLGEASQREYDLMSFDI